GAMLGLVYWSRARRAADARGGALRRDDPHLRSHHDAGAAAVRAVDRSLSRRREAHESRRRGAEPRDFRHDARAAGDAENAPGRRAASVSRRHRSLREVLDDRLRVHPGRNRATVDRNDLPRPEPAINSDYPPAEGAATDALALPSPRPADNAGGIHAATCVLW